MTNVRDRAALDDKMRIEGLNVYYGAFHALKNAALDVPTNRVTALIGPSGCGKSTFLRALNRMHDLTPGARVTGSVLLDGEDIYARSIDPVTIRLRILFRNRSSRTSPTGRGS
jgi:phosphate transport system ATP-binding protein